MTRRAGAMALPLVLALTLTVAGACGDGGAESAGRSSEERASATPSTTTSSTTSPATTATTAAPTTAAPDCSPSAVLTTVTTTLTSGGTTRSYQVAVPPDLDPYRPTPLILNFHGSGSNMAQQAVYSQLPQRGTARGYVVVTPDGTGTPKGWALGGGADDVFVGDLLDVLAQGMCIDEDRVFAAGISNGSAFSALSACRPPYRYAAIGLVAAEVRPAACPAGVRPSVVAFHGTADRVVPYGGGPVNAEGGRGLSTEGAEVTMAEWARHDGCGASPSGSPLGGDVTVLSWTGCAGGAAVTFHRIDGGGHTWPGAIDLSRLGIDRLGATTSSVSATDAMLDLFDRAPDRSW